MDQNTALDILKTGNNVFLTGSAGSGKTYTLNQYIHYLRARKVPVAITASTGIAATHMNGITIHSWSGLGIKTELTDKDLLKISKRNVVRDRIKDTAVLIIDEISMLHAKQLDSLNEILKYVRNSEEAFGGMQVIFAGDFFQLPPVGNREESNRDKFAFMAKSWLEAELHICYLTEQYRQNKNEATSTQLSLNDILNQIRASQVTHQAVMDLQNTANNQINDNRTRLYTHNVSVDRINQTELMKLDTDSKTYHGSQIGDDKLTEMLKKSVRTSEELTLKLKAKVMFIKNINDLNVFNGTMGEIIGFKSISEEETEAYPVVKLNSGRTVIATPEEWMVEDEMGTVLASYSQVPLCLAWAITVHKSQGMTLDAAEIDLSKTFEMGQGYVALSRLKSLSGLKLLGLNETSLRLDPLARGADKRFIELSNDLQDVYQQVDNENLLEAQNDFVLTNGGTINQRVIDAYDKLQQKRLEQQKITLQQKNQTNNIDENTLEKTKVLLEDGFTIAEISQERKLAQATIMTHIARLKKAYPQLACEHLRPDDAVIKMVEEAYIAIKSANDPNDFNDDGSVRLKPIFEYLKEHLNYNTIRLALIFIV